MIKEINSLLKLAEKDKYLKIENGGNTGTGHDIKMLSIEVKELGGFVPKWAVGGTYDLSSWATTVRYNSNYKTNRELINEFNMKIIDWLSSLKERWICFSKGVFYRFLLFYQRYNRDISNNRKA